jgi:hypothetical protein
MIGPMQDIFDNPTMLICQNCIGPKIRILGHLDTK